MMNMKSTRLKLIMVMVMVMVMVTIKRTMIGTGDLLSSNFPEGINREGEFWKVVIDKKKLDAGGRRRRN